MNEEFHLHAYEKLSLGTAGVVMGILLIVLHTFALCKPKATKKALTTVSGNESAALFLLLFDFIWIILLLLPNWLLLWAMLPFSPIWLTPFLPHVDYNPLWMNLFDFNGIRGMLLILCPVVCAVLLYYNKKNELLFPRALGLFLLLLALVPLTAAFLKDPVTRLLIPCWCYPVLTVAMFWVAKPYLFRDWMEKLAANNRAYTLLNGIGAVWGAAILTCALCFWF